MLKSLVKTLVSQLKMFKKAMRRCKGSKPKRVFVGFDGVKTSFAGMELRNQLELVFKFIDANGDGKISSHELGEFLLCLGHDKSKVAEEASYMFQHMDANNDGYVDLNEYINVVMMTDGDHDDAYNDNGYVDDGYDHKYVLEEELMDAFLVFDTDKNGLISARELQNVLKRLGFANSSIKDCSRMIEGADKDGDGFVNFEEFRIMMMGHVSS